MMNACKDKRCFNANKEHQLFCNRSGECIFKSGFINDLHIQDLIGRGPGAHWRMLVTWFAPKSPDPN